MYNKQNINKILTKLIRFYQCTAVTRCKLVSILCMYIMHYYSVNSILQSETLLSLLNE